MTGSAAPSSTLPLSTICPECDADLTCTDAIDVRLEPQNADSPLLVGSLEPDGRQITLSAETGVYPDAEIFCAACGAEVRPLETSQATGGCQPGCCASVTGQGEAQA